MVVVEVVPDVVLDAVVTEEQPQEERTDAIDMAVANISLEHALTMLTAVEKKKMLR